jgi:hypothetical protein
MADYLIEIPLLEPTISSNSLNFQAETDDFEDFQHISYLFLEIS